VDHDSGSWVHRTLDDLVGHLDPDDVVIDGGNSYHRDDIERAKQLASRHLHYVDCGTSGGVWGLERGYCLMIGGEPKPVARLQPIFSSIAPGASSASQTRVARSAAPRKTATCTADLRGRGTSSRWSTTGWSTR
jgi:6-phosphogluconate dehydrogenase